MSSVPLSTNQLETIVEVVARDLLEQWAISDRFTEDQIEKAQQDAVDDTVFVINNFMEHFNTYMMFEADKKSLIK
jgi:uncharacterized FlaG/YvyC family protein